MGMWMDDRKSPPLESAPTAAANAAETAADPKSKDPKARLREIGGRSGAEPTRFGDWEMNGRCIDF